MNSSKRANMCVCRQMYHRVIFNRVLILIYSYGNIGVHVVSVEL